eukprot:Lithocolla_globosa_v1_NODE_9827_length_664_cov_4.638752.p1 type:complete len:152 gc:universal NODE_9827_length_664_cov_4.638752:559-104(-)
MSDGYFVYQTNFSPGQGNALQACVASIFQLPLEDVPNFIEHPKGYQTGIQQWLDQQTSGLAFLKISLDERGGLVFPVHSPVTCLLAGKSPRGEFKHVVVAKINPDQLIPELVFDPHPDAQKKGVEGTDGWVSLFVASKPSLNGPAQKNEKN